MRSKAFTLAEVLITLTIIGVIAALTIPNLYIKYEKQQTVIHLKKVYSLLKQATELSIRENGPIEEWNFNLSNDEFTKKYFNPYLKITFKNQPRDDKPYLATNNERGGYLWYPAQFLLADGTYVFYNFNTPYEVKHHIYIDLNGEKAPNKLGRDIFGFSFYNNSLTTYASYTNQNFYTRDIVSGAGSSSQCNKLVIKGGWYCSKLIEIDGWDIKDDYPW